MSEIPQEDDAGHYVHALETAVDDLRRFAWASQKGREGLALEGKRFIEAQRKLFALAFFLSLYAKPEKDAA